MGALMTHGVLHGVKPVTELVPEVCDTCHCQTGFLVAVPRKVTCDWCYENNQQLELF